MSVAAFIIGVVVAAFSSALFSTLAENTVEAMKSVVDADAALIGFLGIVTVFLLTSTRDEARNISEKILHEDKLHRFQIEKNLSDDKEYSDYKKKVNTLTFFAGYYTGFLGSTLTFALTSAALFVSSIFLALLGMGSDILTKDIGVSGSVITIVLGITAMFLLLSNYVETQKEYRYFEMFPDDFLKRKEKEEKK